ncbi:MAG: BatA and WFA domain-containing protein [Planctomycetota bacterium]|nr:BatA and WFA domain-containing protein [Planctomycetota bacterium]
MSLLHPLLLYGLAFTAIPVLLHFLLRPKPKKLLFPALRLVKIRRKQSVRRLRLRHIWLLLMRIAVITLLILALARPSLPAADYSLSGSDWTRLIVCVGLATALYYGVLHYWKRKSFSDTVFTKKRDQLRGWVAAFTLLLIAFVVMWPYQKRVVAQIRDPIQMTRENLPIAGVFIFDTSLSMDYRQANESRLAVAQNIAGEFLENLSPNSRVAVMETGGKELPIFQADLQSARTRISSLEVKPVSLPFNHHIRLALQLQNEDRDRVSDNAPPTASGEPTDQYIREIYIFTDLARSNWQLADADRLRDEIATWPNGHIYLIDVGSTTPVNVGLTSLRLSRQQVTQGQEFTLSARLQQRGLQKDDFTAELHLTDETGRMVKQGQTTVSPKGDEAVQLDFRVRPLKMPITQGEIRLVNSDPFLHDDTLRFTAEVAPPLEVLVIAPTQDDAMFWMPALAPSESVKVKRNQNRCTYRKPGRLTVQELTAFGAVCLINVPELSVESWLALSSYVQAGGGLFVALGSTEINPVSYQSESAQEVLPGKLLAYLRFKPPTTLDLRNLDHPLFQWFKNWGSVGELSTVTINRYWKVEPFTDAGVLVHYADENGTPALLEFSHGLGRTLMFTTAVDRTQEWGNIPFAGWSFQAFALQTAEYLGQRSTRSHNFTIGEEIPVWLKPELKLEKILLRKPEGQQQALEIGGESSPLLVTAQTDQLGQYQVIAMEETIPFETGFSVNMSPGESDFSRVSEEDLQTLLGDGRFSLARHLEDLEMKVGFARIGIEVFPWLTLALLAFFCIEHVSANRFYEPEETNVLTA